MSPKPSIVTMQHHLVFVKKHLYVINCLLNLFVYQWFFIRRVPVLVPLSKKYKLEDHPLHEYVRLIKEAQERPDYLIFPPDEHDLQHVTFVEYQWVRALPLTGWVNRLKTF